MIITGNGQIDHVPILVIEAITVSFYDKFRKIVMRVPELELRPNGAG
jgi:hypothetical protein